MKHILHPVLTILCCLVFAWETKAQCMFNPSSLPTGVTCYGYNDGTINLNVSGGPAPFTYLWSNGATTEDIANLTSGIYTVTVSDAVGCTMILETVVVQPAEFKITVPDLVLTCTNPNGVISANVTGGGNPPYSWVMSNGNSGSSNVSPIPLGQIPQTGNYSVTVTNAFGCSSVDQFVVTENILPPTAFAGQDITLNCTMPSATLNGAGSSTGPQFAYFWTTTNGHIASNSNTLFPVVDVPATYTLMVVNTQNGCTATDDVVVSGDFAFPAIAVLAPIGIPCGGGLITMPISGPPNTTYSWIGPNSFNSNIQNPTTNVPGIYTVNATYISSGCITVQDIIVYPGPAIPLQNFTVTDLPCTPGVLGAIDMNVDFGVGPYFITWSNGANTEDITNLTSGQYSVTVTDATSCTYYASIEVKQLATNILISSTVAPVLCFGGNSGHIDLTISGGSAPYTYQWSSGNTTKNLVNLTPGTYTVTVTDATSCTKTKVQTVTQPTAITINTSKTNVSCNGSSTGSINLTVSGGVPPYTFNWSNGVTTSILTNLTAGTYSVTITDANGCTKTSSSTITQPAAMNVSSTVVNATCADINNGSIDLSVSGGLLPYTYNWIGPLGYTANIQDPAGLFAGNYAVTVTDASGCTKAVLIVVSAPQPIAIPGNGVVISAPTCFGGANGSIAINPEGGTPPFTYDWSNDGPEDPDNDSKDLTGLGAGLYTVTITDANGCSLESSFTMVEPPAIVITATVTPVPCGSSSNEGAIDLSVAGGTAPYTFIWSDGNTTQNLSGLFSGTYTVTLTDIGGCTVSQTITVLQGGTVDQSSFIVNPASCEPGSMDGVIDLITLPASGTAPFIFTWQGPAGFSAMSQNLTGLVSGAYELTITDAGNCQFTSTVLVDKLPGDFVLDFNPTVVTCNATIIGVSVSNGTGPYSYLWSTGETTPSLNIVVSGTYTITVTDGLGCSKTTSTTVVIPPALTLSADPTPATCSGINDGAVTLTILGGVLPYTYNWNNGATTQNLSNVAPGTYCVTVSDANGCSAISCATVDQTLPMGASIAASPTTCFTGTTGGLLVALFNEGTGPYNWNLVGPVQSSGSSPANVFNIPGLPGGTYCLTVTNASGCSTVVCTVITSPSPIIATIDQLSNSCDAAVIKTTVSGGVVPFTYAWQNGAPLPDITQTIVATAAGTYEVLVTDANGCTSTANIMVTPANGGACGYIRGSVVDDDNGNCTIELNEPGLAGWLVRAEGLDTLYGITDANGKYLVNVPAGTYTMAVLPPNNLWQVCPLSIPATINMANDTVFGGDFPVKPHAFCPALSISIGALQARRCFSSNYYDVTYCNQGTAAAENAYIEVTFDPNINFVSSAIPSQVIGTNVRRFFVGDVNIGECGTFSMRFFVSCSAVLGQALCTEAHIFPDTLCNTNAQWSGASLAVRSVCNTDSLKFVIKNVGNGNMVGISDYIVVEDAVMLMQAPIPMLDAGDSVSVSFPANGSTWRVEVEQEANHPYPQPAALSVEGCTTSASFSTGYVNQFAISDYSPSVDIDCTTVTGSYDPNDKQGYPIGYGAAHYVRPGTEIEYMIRFQNTGTDTAFTVRIIDTLSTWLDPASIKFGASSHPYRYDLCGEGIVQLIFENILLPDSNVNEVASHGYATFSIKPRANAPLESVIENTAAIYFDFNDPVRTNTTWHRLGENFLSVGLWQPHIQNAQVIATPNPFSDETVLSVNGLKNDRVLRLQVFDFQGNEIRTMESQGNSFRLKKGEWPAGMYFFKITQQGKIVGNGKLIAQ